MTPTIIITGLVAALFASLWLNYLQAGRIKHWKARCELMVRNMETQTELNLAMAAKEMKRSLNNYDPDNYSDLTSAQKHRIGERS